MRNFRMIDFIDQNKQKLVDMNLYNSMQKFSVR